MGLFPYDIFDKKPSKYNKHYIISKDINEFSKLIKVDNPADKYKLFEYNDEITINKLIERLSKFLDKFDDIKKIERISVQHNGYDCKSITGNILYGNIFIYIKNEYFVSIYLDIVEFTPKYITLSQDELNLKYKDLILDMKNLELIKEYLLK